MSEDGQMRLVRIATALSLLLVVVNHVLPPKAFSATQLLFDYEFGLIRRGLAGEVLGWIVGQQVSLGEIYLASVVVTLVGVFAFYLFLQREVGDSLSGQLLLILGLNSFAFASFAGNTGYLDALLLALVLASLTTDATSLPGLAARVLVCLVGVLLHENMLPYFALLLGFDLFLARGGGRKATIPALAPVAAGGVLVACLAVFAELPPDSAAVLAAHVADRADFAFDPNATAVAGRSIGDNFDLMQEMRRTTKYWTWMLFDGVPLAVMAVWLGWLGRRMLGEAATPLALAALAAVLLAPLSLNLIAFDVVRFGVSSVLSGFIALALIARYVDGASERLQETLSWPHFLIVLVLNANMFTIEVNIGAGHMAQFPWVLVTQLQWLAH